MNGIGITYFPFLTQHLSFYQYNSHLYNSVDIVYCKDCFYINQNNFKTKSSFQLVSQEPTHWNRRKLEERGQRPGDKLWWILSRAPVWLRRQAREDHEDLIISAGIHSCLYDFFTEHKRQNRYISWLLINIWNLLSIEVFDDYYDDLSQELGQQDDSRETLPLMFLRSPEKRRRRKGTGVKYHRCYHNPVSCF